MREYIRKNLKKITVAAVLFVVIVAFVGAGELFARKLPEASELTNITWCLEDVHCYEYTGEEIQPSVSQITFVDAEEQTITRTKEEFAIVGYSNNIEIGYASIEVQLDGYNGTIILNNAFYIYPAKVMNVELSYDSEKCIDLAWDAINDADGYIVYRSTDNEKSYDVAATIDDSTVSNYRDAELAYNTTYSYKVRAYSLMGSQRVSGSLSDSVKQTTILSTPVISADMESYNSIGIYWEAVDGAAGYQVYRSDSQNGEYECIKEFADGKSVSYIDADRECGISYYYYIKAKQTVNNQDIGGKASNIVSAKTTPNYVGISGNVSNEYTQVTLSWKQSSGAQGYEVYRSSGYSSDYKLMQKLDQNTTTWTDTGLDKDTEYFYRIRPYIVVNGTTITGSYSNIFTKEAIVIVSDYAQTGSGSLGGVTQYAGTSYKSGGYTPSGWDCSGFTKWALQEYYGVSIPKPASSQGSNGTSISMSDRSQWQPGDILAYSDGSRICHVALYLGDGQLMHALNEKYDTVIQGVDYYENWDGGTRLVAVKRYH